MQIFSWENTGIPEPSSHAIGMFPWIQNQNRKPLNLVE